MGYLTVHQLRAILATAPDDAFVVAGCGEASKYACYASKYASYVYSDVKVRLADPQDDTPNVQVVFLDRSQEAVELLD